MCLITSQKYPKTAKKDIIVWKLICRNGDKINSPLFGCEWEKNVIKEVSLGIKRFSVETIYGKRHCMGKGFTIILAGFHAYKTKKIALEELNEKISPYTIKNMNIQIEKFTIPKYSKYFSNKNEIVSDHMMWVPEK